MFKNIFLMGLFSLALSSCSSTCRECAKSQKASSCNCQAGETCTCEKDCDCK